MNELELILTDVFNCSRADLYSNSSALLKKRELTRLENILKNRAKNIPIQYILGYAEFMGLRFKVREGVLIPRPETEILVETAMDKIKNLKPSILDIGTGSGCIAISLAKFLKGIDVVAVDISHEAINLSRENSISHNVQERVTFLKGDFFDLIKNRSKLLHKKFDVIVTNPPYVSTSEIGMFDKTTTFEPRIALDGGKDGLDFYRRLSESAGTVLKKDGLLIIEIGYNQAKEIKKIFSCGWNIEEIIKDYQGIERVLVIRQESHG